jgi:hypothetical protein
LSAYQFTKPAKWSPGPLGPFPSKQRNSTMKQCKSINQERNPANRQHKYLIKERNTPNHQRN